MDVGQATAPRQHTRRYVIDVGHGQTTIAEAVSQFIEQAQNCLATSLDRATPEEQLASLWGDLQRCAPHLRRAADDLVDVCDQHHLVTGLEDADSVLQHRDRVLGSVSHQLSLLLAVVGLAGAIKEVPSESMDAELLEEPQ